MKALRWTATFSLALIFATGCVRYDVNQRCCDSEYEIVSQNYRLPDTFGLYIPQVFTPNSDGLNDQFRPLGTGWTIESMVIKRGLKTVYESSSHLDAFWDGGEEKDGRYRYEMTFRSSLGDPFDVKGEVCVFRYGDAGERIPEMEREKVCSCVTDDMIVDSLGVVNETLECPQNGL